MGKKKGKRSFKGKHKTHRFSNRVFRPEVVFTQSMMELLCEYQTKYQNLFSLSKEYDHKLLDAIACEIYQRFTHLINGFQEELTNYNFTRNYRRMYPHCDDLKFVQEKMWLVNKQLEQPLRDLSLQILTKDDRVENPLTIAELTGSSSRILVPLAMKIESYIKNLDTSESGPKQVIRQALKRQASCIQELLIETINETVMPDIKNMSYGKMRIYGEPHLPATNIFQTLLNPFHPSGQMRSHRMYNCALLNVPLHGIEPFLKMDGTVVAGVRLVCRRSIQPEYRLPAFIVAKIKEFFNISAPEATIGLDEAEEAEDEAEEHDDEKSDQSEDS